MWLIYLVFSVAIFVLIIHLRNNGEITIGDIAFIISLTFLFFENSWYATLEIKKFLENLESFKSAFAIMKVAKCNIDHPSTRPFYINKAEIIFNNLSFGYNKNNQVLHNLNLHIPQGQKVGLVGPSGAGKSTLISLLLKHFKTCKGDITIDDASIYDLCSEPLRSQISLIPQDIALFHRTIAENIGYARQNITHDEIVKAAKMANIHDLITSLPESYNTMVGERGVKLSGGQRQRIAIARAILKKSSIFIMDEATSNLDSKTEKEIQNAIEKILQDNKITFIAIAHRLSTIKNMDRIIVMDQGKIIEDGTFTDLIKQENSKFKELWDHQVNGMIL